MNHFGLATPPQKFPLFWSAVLGREKAAIGMLISLQLPHRFRARNCAP
jgi:hypothetical protein